ncbi:D-alanine--D-alanine ligase [Frankia sp. B2]|uniref:D-alanine--D-alanine ligase family protein n=1 Tax=Frankia TaxID=1854 RepID=UPI0003D00BCA|nr:MULTISPECIES: D-alanine--D-alanine ligase family protein [Frankia]ETA03566.1 D-alanine--D-alanine ligase [Frankia sp. CcI6]KDA43754.1 D-alanine--D-alanine ligase [Frankia sp. BMG5.23]KFB05177.1 D-alanine--D-alanine ligase [Frankia sp. Allo2]OAA26112.1 D-alanine--D-alanine ligase [Frankia casuarinae]OHV55715.1 D-alanine--D-alanine ligase A [Frankia sp. CgIS1]
MAGSRRRIRLALLFGGRSTEHAISCISASGVLRALDRDVYDVVPVGIDTHGRWVVLPDDPTALAVTGDRLPAVVAAHGESVVLAADPTTPGLLPCRPRGGLDSVRNTLGSSDALGSSDIPGDIDVVFPLLHGPFGEDGTVQGLLEMAGLPYVGSGVFASAAAMDKQHMKALLRAAGLPVGSYAVLRAGDTLTGADQERLGLPVFVKPARGGSSIGISRVEAWADLDTAIKAARASDPKVLVESAIVGREIECGVLGILDGPGAEASVPAEITVTSSAGFYDFEAKYMSDATHFDVPANLSHAVREEVRGVAIAAFEALDCAGLARVDMFVTADDHVIINEVNTMPGFTPTSMFPRMWEASGVTYPQLVDRLVRLALRDGAGLR